MIVLNLKEIKRIIHVSSQDIRYQTGGQGVTVENYCREQLALGYEVCWVSCRIKGFKEDEEIDYDGSGLKIVRISCSDSEKISTPYEGSEMRQYLRRQEFGQGFVRFIEEKFSPTDTLVHLHGFFYIPLMAQNLEEYRTVSQYHLLLTKRMEALGEEGDVIYSFIRSRELESFEAAKKILAVSTGAAREILHIYPPAREKIFVVPGGIESRYLKSPFYPKAERFTVLSWGRISAEKNFEAVMEAARLLPEIDFIIFGKTGDTERNRGEYHQRLLNLSQGIKNLQFIATEEGITGEEKLQLIDACDVVVVPSWYEPFGLVILEAMARGKPVIASPVYGAHDIMETEKRGLNNYGIICHPLPQEIKQAIELLSINNNLRQRMAEKCQSRAVDFLWPSIVKRLMEIYKERRSQNE